MKKGKIIIASAAAVMLSLTGVLTYNLLVDRPHKSIDSATASAMTVPPEDIIQSNQEKSTNYTYIPPVFEYDDNNSKEDVPSMNESIPPEIPWTPATELDLDHSSITVFVNKEYTLPKDYVPEDMIIPDVLFDITGNDERKLLRMDAAIALEQLFAAASADGYTLYGVSGYRSYTRQETIFKNNIVTKGKKHTLKYSAVPGTSEHQTGLAIDVSTKKLKFRLVTTFANSPEGRWLADHAHYFGYIIRYPKNRSDLTGYAYEPWHIRYVGKDLAKYLYTNGLTLEEYYNYTPSEDFDFEATYAELINYVPPVTPTPTPDEASLPVEGDLDGDGIVDDLDGDGIPDYTDEHSGDEPMEGENTDAPGEEASEPEESTEIPEVSTEIPEEGNEIPEEDTEITEEDTAEAPDASIPSSESDSGDSSPADQADGAAKAPEDMDGAAESGISSDPASAGQTLPKDILIP